MNAISGSLLIVVLLIPSSTAVTVTPGVLIDAPKGYVISNFDPSFNSTYNTEIYGPNFFPGFQAGLTNISIDWNSGNGYASFGYSVGPWPHNEAAIVPHFAAGLQCCNFKEVPHTQQFSQSEWADHYYSRAGLGPPGVNVENYTAVWGDPTSYVGLRTNRDWTLQLSLNWGAPIMMNPTNEWGAIGIAASQYVRGDPGNLVYTLVNLWMDSNSSRSASPGIGTVHRGSSSPNVVVYHPVQIMSGGNQTITIDLSSYLQDTLRLLQFQISPSQPPVIPYVYLNVEGYNFEWNATLWSFKLMTQSDTPIPLGSYVLATGAFGVVMVAVILYLVLRKKPLPVSQGRVEGKVEG